jgi:hypothetical protein
MRNDRAEDQEVIHKFAQIDVFPLPLCFRIVCSCDAFFFLQLSHSPPALLDPLHEAHFRCWVPVDALGLAAAREGARCIEI